MNPSSRVSYGPYQPGALGRLCAWQVETYAPSHGFGLGFEAKVAGEMAAFLRRLDASRDLFLTASLDGTLAGGITLDGGAEGTGHAQGSAHLRWYVVAPAARGHGIGKGLLAGAMDFLHSHGYHHCWLTTVGGLDASAALYAAAGFRVTARIRAATWGREAEELRMEWTAAA